MATTEVTDQERNALIDNLRPFCGARPISPEARGHFVHVMDGDDARDLALDYDEDLRLDFPVDRLEDR